MPENVENFLQEIMFCVKKNLLIKKYDKKAQFFIKISRNEIAPPFPL